MPVFSYTARGFHGEYYAGTMTAENQQAVIVYVKQNKGIPITISSKEEHEAGLYLLHALFSVGRLREWSVWCTSLSRLLAAGIPVLRALGLLSHQIRSPTVWRAFDAVVDDILAGASLSGALKSRGAVFPDLVQLMAAAGEQSGQLEEMMAELGRFLQRQEDFRRRVRSVLAYPFVVACGGLTAAGVFYWFVLPKLDQFYAALAVGKPSFDNDKIIGIALASLVLGGWQLLYQPFRLWKKVQLALFCHTMGLLLQAGINYLDAVALACRTIHFFPGCQAQGDRLADGLEKGCLLSGLLSEWTALFDAVDIAILRAGEESGKLDLAFSLCAEQAETTGEQIAENWVLWSQPFFVLLMTLLTGTLLYHLVMPLFQLALVLPDQL